MSNYQHQCNSCKHSMYHDSINNMSDLNYQTAPTIGADGNVYVNPIESKKEQKQEQERKEDSPIDENHPNKMNYINFWQKKHFINNNYMLNTTCCGFFLFVFTVCCLIFIAKKNPSSIKTYNYVYVVLIIIFGIFLYKECWYN